MSAVAPPTQDDPLVRHVCAACDGRDLVAHLEVAHALDQRGLVPTTDAYGTALDDIVRCTACGHMQLANLPAEADLLELYEDAASHHYVSEEDGQRHTARQTLALIARHAAGPHPPRLLDLGCWVGFLLAEARERGWEVTGVEPSTFAAAYARDRLGLPVQHADLFTADLPDGDFDVVVLGDVIEHLPDPAAALERIGALLAPDGVLFMALPDAGSTVARRMGRRWWSVIPTHVQYFTRPSMVALLRRTGYTPLAIGTAPKTFSVRYYLGRLSGYSPSVSAALIRVATAVRLAERLWTPDFRDRLGVVARKAPGSDRA